VVARDDLAKVLAVCTLRTEKEIKIKEELKKGKSTLELYGFDKTLEAKGLKES
jgi:hypothetical protein